MQLIAASTLFVSALLLELCWVGAWATFVWAGVLQRVFPLPDMILCAVLSALFVRATARLQLRNISILSLHALSLTAFWFCDLKRLQPAPEEAGTLGFWLALSTVTFWTSGALHARRELTHRAVCGRFDFGMYWMLALLGLRLLLRGQAQVPQDAALTDALVPCFFLNALCAICIARYRSQVTKQWLRVSGQLAMVFGALVLLGALGFSITWMFRPYLRTLAATTHAGAAVVARPIMNTAAELVFFVMREGKKRPIPQYVPGRMPIPYPGRRTLPDEPIEMVPVDEPVLTALLIATGILALLGALTWLWWKRHWLWAKQNDTAPASDFWAQCLQLWRRALLWLRALGTNADAEPLRLMNALLIWGERSGVTRRGAETPLEYARRLKQRFAALSGEIDQIIDNHSRQTYALKACDEHELKQARRALRQLRSPRRWWLRSVSRWQSLHARNL